MPPRLDRRRKRIALAVSLIANLVAFAWFGLSLRTLPTRDRDTTTTAQIITISKHTPTPEPTIRPTLPPTVLPTEAAAPPPPQATAVPPPPVAPPHPTLLPPVRHEISKPKPRATLPPEAAPPVAAPVATAPPAVAHTTTITHHRPGKPRLSESQIAAIDGDMANAIAQDKAGASDVLHVDHPAPVATPKDYGSSYGSFDDIGAGRTGHGLCDPMSDWTADGYDYYYVACEVHLSDGGQQREIIPWPVRFPPNDNPFNGTAHGNVPLAMPLPGWHNDGRTVISEELRAYARENGVTL